MSEPYQSVFCVWSLCGEKAKKKEKKKNNTAGCGKKKKRSFGDHWFH